MNRQKGLHNEFHDEVLFIAECFLSPLLVKIVDYIILLISLAS